MNDATQGIGGLILLALRAGAMDITVCKERVGASTYAVLRSLIKQGLVMVVADGVALTPLGREKCPKRRAHKAERVAA